MSSDDEPTFERGNTGERISIRGVVTSAVASTGSHSEHLVPTLVDDDGRHYRLLLVGENPMEQPTLHALQGQPVSVAGTWRNGVVRVEATDLDANQDRG